MFLKTTGPFMRFLLRIVVRIPMAEIPEQVIMVLILTQHPQTLQAVQKIMTLESLESAVKHDRKTSHFCFA